MNLSVLGAGNGAQTLAGHLASKGNAVMLFEHPDFPENLKAIKQKGNRIRLDGVLSCTGELKAASSDISEVVGHGEILFVLMPSYAQERVFDLAMPFLREGQLIVFMPGNFASLVAKRKLSESNLRDKGVLIAETDTIPYACRLKEPGESSVYGLKDYLSISSLPGSRIDDVLAILKPVFPIPMSPMKNVLNVGFANTNMILHCPTMIMNAGRIEFGAPKFGFYEEGMTPSVCRVMEGMDEERLRVGEKLGLKLKTEFEDILANYPMEGDFKSLYEVIQNCEVYVGHGADSPDTLTFRYISEDVPFLLVPVAQFGDLVGEPTPLIDAVIALSEVANGAKYRESGRTLRALGLESMSLEEIKEYVR